MNMTIRIDQDNERYEMMSLSEAMLKFIAALFIVANKEVNDELLRNGNFNFILDNGNDLVINGISESDTFYSDVDFGLR